MLNKRALLRNSLALAAAATLGLTVQAEEKTIKIGVTAGPTPRSWKWSRKWLSRMV